ncbi:MAG TPA: hypothetical protein DEP79_13715 [Gammaproteobacteria bacterium]|nr:hypothetical protein [Gammaproteobacteria bacterium]
MVSRKHPRPRRCKRFLNRCWPITGSRRHSSSSFHFSKPNGISVPLCVLEPGAAPLQVERSTGYVLGGVSPLGQKKRLKTVMDASALEWETVFVSAGKRGLEIELSPADMKALLGAVVASITQ